MKTRTQDGRKEYQCDQCGAWSQDVFLVTGRLLCLVCMAPHRPADLIAHAHQAIAISEALRRRLERRRL